jgi:dethiobiotin synthetase
LKIFITSIDTNIGKTIASSVLCSGLNYSYWKPIQCGDLDQSDSFTVNKLSPSTHIYPESYRLNLPMSPHEAGFQEEVEIKLKNIELPLKKHIIIEGAGGVMVPLNYNGDLMVDIIKKLNARVIVVFKNYLGSINHTILTIEQLKACGLCVIGSIVTGDRVESSEKIIQSFTKTKIVGHIPFSENINVDWVTKQGEIMAKNLSKELKL